MDMAASVLHHTTDGVSSASDNVRVVSVTHLHFQSYTIALLFNVKQKDYSFNQCILHLEQVF